MTKQRWTNSGLVVLGMVVLWALAPGGLRADITATGDYGPAYTPGTDPWNVGGSPLQIGIDAAGQVTVTLTSVINAGTMVVGLRVNGAQDKLGELTIQDSGQVNVANVAFIGGASEDLMGQSEDAQGGPAGSRWPRVRR